MRDNKRELMAHYRIHRLKDSQRAQFRFAPHVSGLSQVRPKDYTPGGEVAADHPYAAWTSLRGTPEALELGDLLEGEAGQLSILKYVGFDQARWLVVEPVAPPTAADSGSEAAPQP